MTDQTPNPTPAMNEHEPFIPPYYMLILAAIGLIGALIVRLTQPQFTVVGWGALGLGLLSLVAWVFMAPDQARAILTGRTAKYGGTTVLVTGVFLFALIAIYGFVKGQNIRLDLTQRDTFSLNEQTRPVIAQLGADPTAPNIKILAFYSQVQASRKDQDSVLFEDYVTTSGGKISYEFIDPDRNPLDVQTYEVTRPGQIVVVALKEDGTPDSENAELVQFFSQEELSNAILRVSASGDFRAYFLSVEGGLSIEESDVTGLSNLRESFTDTFAWDVQEVNFLQLTSPGSEIQLNDPNADGEVLVIVGGTSPLSDDQLQFITDYLDAGGDLVLYAAPFTPDGSLTLATADNLSTYLTENYGLSFNNDIVMDQVQAVQTIFAPFAVDFDTGQFVTSTFANFPNAAVIFEQTRSIQVAPTLPEGITVTELARSSDTAFSKTDPAALQVDEIAPADTDPKGPFVLAAASENSATGSRVVLLGSMYVGSNQYEALRNVNVYNWDMALRSMVWVTHFDEFFNRIPQLQAQTRPEDTPIFVDQQAQRNISLLTVVVLPFGILLIGVLVWWSNRERAR